MKIKSSLKSIKNRDLNSKLVRRRGRVYVINKKPLTVVKPGNQTRRFTHIQDTIKICYEAFKVNECKYYSITNKYSYSIFQVAKMFKSKIVFLKPRLGERYASALTKITNNNKIIQKFGKLQLKDYITSFINSH